jgi:hypothetical protein
MTTQALDLPDASPAHGGHNPLPANLLALPMHAGPNSLTFLGHNLIEAAVFAKAMHAAGIGGRDSTPQSVLARIMLGLELQIPPMVAIRELYVVSGRCGMSSRLMHALARRGGARIRYVVSDDLTCTVAIRAPGETDEQTFTWTVDRAQKAGLFKNETWTKYTAQMLRARAVSESVNAVCPEVVAGGMHTIEELNDMVPDVTPAEGGTAKEKAGKLNAAFDDVFKPTGPDPFEPTKGKKPVDAVATTTVTPAVPPTEGNEPIRASTEGEPSAASPAAPAVEPDQPKESYYQRRKRLRLAAEEQRREGMAPTKLEDGVFAMTRAITLTAERKGLIFVDGRVDVQSFGPRCGLEKNAYSPSVLAREINAAEILREIEAYEPANGLT